VVFHGACGDLIESRPCEGDGFTFRPEPVAQNTGRSKLAPESYRHDAAAPWSPRLHGFCGQIVAKDHRRARPQNQGFSLKTDSSA